jgi:hypothetical protein
MSTPPPAPERPRFSLEDAAGLVVAIVLGVASFVYPFGRDQGLYYYVGREWALRGAIPYRDVFDHKTPGACPDDLCFVGNSILRLVKTDPAPGEARPHRAAPENGDGGDTIRTRGVARDSGIDRRVQGIPNT